MNNYRYSFSRSSLARYTLDGESSRWWWTPAAGGAFATVAVVAIVSTSSPVSAIPVVPDGYGISVPAQPPGSPPGHVDGSPGLRPSVESPNPPPGQRQCFIWQSHWNEALDGPQPLCPIEP